MLTGWKTGAVYGAIILVAALMPQVLHGLGKDYYLTQFTMAMYYALVVLGLCLLMGWAGQVSMGQGAFFALGGYTSAILTTHDFSSWGSSAWLTGLKSLHLLLVKPGPFGGEITVVAPWAAFGVAFGLTIVVAGLIGYPALRLKGHYLAMATLGFGLIIHKVVVGTSFLGAADGIQGVPEWRLVGDWAISGRSALRVSNFYIACGVLLGVLFFLQNLRQSRVGRALQAIHDRELAANAMGIPTPMYKLRAFVISAVLAGLAGVCFTHYTGGIGPSEAGALKSVRYLALCAVGGMANLWGVAVMSVLINFMSLRGWLGSYDNAVFGLLLIVIISWFPQGPLKPLTQWWRDRRCAQPPPKAVPS